MSNTTGGLRLTIQPINIESNDSGSGNSGYNANLKKELQTNLVSQSELGALSPAVIQIEKNHDAFYLNPDLESILNTRGFSTQRPEILGMFNYVPPLGKGSDEDNTDKFLITPAGELYDFQCQLKQLRYKDALGFFQKMLGFYATELGMGSNGLRLLPGRGPGQKFHGFERRLLTSSEKEFNEKLLAKYGTEMKLARAVLDYLQRIYDSITAFIHAQELSRSYNILPPSYISAIFTPIVIDLDRPKDNPTKTNPVSQDCYESVLENIPRYKTDWAVLSQLSFGLESETSATFNEFLLSVFDIKDDAGDSFIQQFSMSSGTVKVLQALQVLAAGVYGMRAFPSTQWLGITNSEKANAAYEGNLIGWEHLGLDNSMIWSCFGQSELSVSTGFNPTISIEGGETLSSSELFNRLNFYASSASKSENRDSLLTYLIGLDTIQSFRFATMDSVAGFTPPSADSGPSGVEDLLTKIYGRNTKSNLSSIATNMPSPGTTNVTRCILAPNTDSTLTDTRSYIETFTKSNHELALGVEHSRTGRSFYCDEIPTNELDESKVRIAGLKSNFSRLSDMMSDMIKTTSCPFPDSSSYMDAEDDQFGYSDAYPRKMVPGTFYSYLLKALADSTKAGFTQNYDDQEDIENSYLFNFIIAAIASEDDEIAYLVTCLNLAYCDAKDGKIDFDEFRDVASYLETRAVDRIRNDFLEAVENGTAEGNGHGVFYGDGPANDDKIHHPNVYDHRDDNKTMSSAYRYFPIGNDGVLLDKAGGGFEAVEEGTAFMIDLFCGKASYWGSNNSAEAPKNILLVPYFAVSKFAKDVRTALGASGTIDWGYSVRGYGKKAKIAAVTNMCRDIWRESFRNTVYFQYKTVSSGTGGKNEYTISSTTVRALFAMNMRSAMSLINAAEMMVGEDVFSPYNFRRRGNENGTHLSEFTPAMTKEDVFLDGESGASAGTSSGHQNTTIGLCQGFKSTASQNLRKERSFHASSLLVCRAIDQLQSAATNLLSAIESTDLESSTFDNALGEIRSDPDFSSAALFGITRDQLSLNRALYDSFGSPNREYPYLPATKAVLSNETKNLSAFLKQNEFLESSSGSKKFICPVGIPAGMLESLRLRLMDATGDVSYRESTIVEVSIWKRDLLHENIIYEPKRFVFDTSIFVITGRSTSTAAGSNLIDSAVTAIDPQEFETLKQKSVMRKYEPSGNVKTFLGKVTSNPYSGDGFNSYGVFDNHINDHYLQVFSKLTTGFDFSEDVFPFLEGNVFFDGVDEENEEIFNDISTKAREMFVDIDIESALNYDRLLGELKRSIYMSPKKYRNRIIYPKVFERVFCVLIDPEDFDIRDNGTSQFSEDPSELPQGNYTQYYVTVGLKPAEGSDEYEYQFANEQVFTLEKKEVDLEVSNAVSSGIQKDFIQF